MNHILPTNGAARYRGGISVRDFLKVVTYQSVSKEGARKMTKIASKFGEIEGLEAQLLLSREENAWLREQIDGYRNAFHNMETQHSAVGAQAKAYIKGIEQEG